MKHTRWKRVNGKCHRPTSGARGTSVDQDGKYNIWAVQPKVKQLVRGAMAVWITISLGPALVLNAVSVVPMDQGDPKVAKFENTVNQRPAEQMRLDKQKVLDYERDQAEQRGEEERGSDARSTWGTSRRQSLHSRPRPTWT